MIKPYCNQGTLILKKKHTPLKDLDTTEIFIRFFSSVFISFEEERDGDCFFCCILPATEKLSGTFCVSLKSNRTPLVLRCTHAWHLLVQDLLRGSQVNSFLLLRLGNTTLLGNGEVAGSLWALGYNDLIDSVSTEHAPVSRSSLFQSRPLGLITVSSGSSLRSALVWQVTLFLCHSLPPWLERWHNSSVHMCTVLQTTAATITATLESLYVPSNGLGTSHSAIPVVI